MKKIIALLLCVAVLLSLAGCGRTDEPVASVETMEIMVEPTEEPTAPVNNTPYDGEIIRANTYGFLPEDMPEDLETGIQYSQFVALMDQLLAVYDVTPSDVWVRLEKYSGFADRELTRIEGAVIVYYTARELGFTTESVFNDFGTVDEKFWEGITWNYSHIPDINSPYINDMTGEPEPDLNMVHTAAWFIQRHPSTFDNSMLLEVDEEYSFRWGDPMTWDDSIKALVRLYESDWDVSLKLDIRDWLTEESLEYFELAEKRKAEIMSSPTEVEISGTSYYVSQDGDDNNDGLSPETPWASIERVNKASLRSGDGVFFRRGDMWRGVCLMTKSGVTYSAYGEGAKPILSGSPENGAGGEKWTLFYEDDTGKKIWQFHSPLSDCGNVYFNDGESWGFKRTGHWRYGKWVDDDNNDLDIIALLDKDLSFFGDISSNLPKTNTIEPITFYSLYTEGPLYLRCDKGNPGEVYDSIEFGCHAKGSSVDLISMENGVTLDNLAILYVARPGIMISNTGGTVQNCEIGFCGGNIQVDNYSTEWTQTTQSVTCGGGGASLWGENNSILNCYFHDTYQEGFTIERDDIVNDGITVKGNLFSNTMSFFFNHYGEELGKPCLSNSLFEDNVVLMSGFNWGCTQRTMYQRHGSGIAITSEYYNLENVAFRNNTFIGCYGHLIQIAPTKEGKNIPIMEGNTFCSLTADATGYYKSAFSFVRQYPVKMSDQAIAADTGNDTNRFLVLEQVQKTLQ